MRLLLAVSLGTSLVFLGQEVAPAQTGNPGQVEQKAAAEKPSITLPAGTKVMLAMTTPVWSKTVKSGDSLYCTTNFPVTIDNQMAIPPGTYAQGTIDSVTKPTRKTNNADFQVHFTKLIFANGYTVELPADSPAATATIHVQVNYQSDILLDNGSQFEMTLQSPLTLDAANVAVAVRRSKAPPLGPYQSATRCRPTPGTPGTSDTVIPGTPGTPGTPDTVIPGGPGMPDTVIPGIPATPGTPDTVLPGSPGTPGIVCPGPPIVTSGPQAAPGGPKASPAENHAGYMTLSGPTEVGGQKLETGTYQLQWAGQGPTAQVQINRSGKTIASVKAQVVVLDQKAAQDEHATRSNPDGSDTLASVKFRNQMFQLIFD
ncbi:MAG TPA: hypothetical protein VJY15_02285 [Candidatus Acidoferrum sp.]|nr:hypothetical protein [Candidatus Acidoferrum sp.]